MIIKLFIINFKKNSPTAQKGKNDYQNYEADENRGQDVNAYDENFDPKPHKEANKQLDTRVAVSKEKQGAANEKQGVNGQDKPDEVDDDVYD